MNKILTLLCLLVAAAAAVVFFVSQGDDPDASRPGVTTVEARGPEATVGDPVSAARPFEIEGATEAADDGDAGLDRIAVAATPTGAALIVQVWDGKQGVPAREAQVFVLDGFAGRELKDPFAQHWSDLAETRGQRFRTDGDGRVELPPVRSSSIVTATLPGSYGFARVGPQHRDVETITLEADETVTVRVTGPDGLPAALVPVGVVQQVPVREKFEQLVEQWKMVEVRMARADAYLRDNPSQREAVMGRVQGLREEQARLAAVLGEMKNAAKGGGNDSGKDSGKGKDARGQQREQKQPPPSARAELRAQRHTDKDGIAVFRHFQIYRQQSEAWWAPEQIDRFAAVLMMPLEQPEARAFTGRPVPSQVIELRMPPVGSIALRTVDRDGRPFTHPVHAELHLHEAETAPWARLQARKEQNETAIKFPFVGLGLQFTASCRLDDDDFRWQAPPFAGPMTPGENLTIDLVVAPGEGMLFGRVLDAAGKPLAGANPTFLINCSAGRLEGEQIVLDAGGRFHLPYLVRPQHRAPFRFEIRRDDVRPTAGLATLLDTLPTGIVTDLGDLQIDGMGCIASGTVVDDRGMPVAGASLQLQRERDVGQLPSQMAFVDEAFAIARSDADGNFDLFGELERARYRLHVQAREHFPFDSPDLRRLDQMRPEPLRVQLQRRSRVVGTVLRPEWLTSKGVSVTLTPIGSPGQVREDALRDFQGKTFAYFDWVRPGVYDLALRVREFPDPFLRIDRLVIEPGQMDVHPRLQDLDLSAYLYRFEIAAVDQDGQPMQPDRPLIARIQRPDGSRGNIGLPWQKNGRAEAISASPQMQVLPLAGGYQAEPALLVAGRNELRFLAIPPVDLLLPGMRQLVGELQVQVLMELIEASDLPTQLDAWDGASERMALWYGKARYAAAALGERDTARVTLMRGGRHRVSARLSDGRKRMRPVSVDLGEVTVRLDAGQAPPQVLVSIDAARVQQAVIELAQRQATGGK